MTHAERLKFMRRWLKDLNNADVDDGEGRREIEKEKECLSWAIKECQKSVDRKVAEKRGNILFRRYVKEGVYAKINNR